MTKLVPRASAHLQDAERALALHLDELDDGELVVVQDVLGALDRALDDCGTVVATARRDPDRARGGAGSVAAGAAALADAVERTVRAR